MKEFGEQVKIPEVKKYLSTVIKSLKSLISGNKTCMKIQDEKSRKRKVAEGIAGNLTNILKDSKENGSTKKNTTQEANKRNYNVSSMHVSLLFRKHFPLEQVVALHLYQLTVTMKKCVPLGLVFFTRGTI